MFKTDGSVDREGKLNEISLKTKLESEAKNLFKDLNPSTITVELRGGTKNKEDLIVTDGVEVKKISAKLKKKLSSGSFDYVNSSSAIAETKGLAEVKNLVKAVKSENSSVNVARQKLNSIFHSKMLSLTTQELSSLLIKHVVRPNEDKFIIITDGSSNKNYMYNFIDSPTYHHCLNSIPTIVFGKSSKTSAKLIFNTTDGEKIDIGLRIRLVLNNGVTALLGKSESNSNSTPVIKIQQDAPHKLIESIKNTTIF